MTVVATQSALVNQTSAVRLARYAQLIEYDECSFFGVANPDAADLGCRQIWLKSDRDLINKYLAEAQYEIEQETGYPLAPRWIGQGQTEEYLDWQAYPSGRRILTRFTRFIEAGIEATSTISAGAAVDHSTDPAVIGPVATTVTDTDEIRVYHPGLAVEIDPSSITISGGNLTIEIPRCRMVKQSVADNPEEGLDYDDLDNFESTVDLKRIYNDSTTQATLAYPSSCTGCKETTLSGCFYVRNKRLGILDIQLTGNGNGSCSCRAKIIKLNYRAGADVLTPQAEDAIVRLAHSKMPFELCGCERWSRLWRRDRETPKILSRERLNCPFGLNNGAWIAWQFAQSMKIMRGAVL
jgi:hypothetical protein